LTRSSASQSRAVGMSVVLPDRSRRFGKSSLTNWSGVLY
jgi:hypothetical protein